MKKLLFALVSFLSTSLLFSQSLDDAKNFINNENYFRARQVLFRLLSDPTQDKAQINYYLGNAYLKSDDPDSAKIFYSLVYNPDVKNPLGLVALGRLALLAKNTTEAKTDFDRALQLTKFKNADIYFEIGDAYFRPNVIDINAAIENLEHAFELNNKNIAIILELGDAYLETEMGGGKAMNKYEYALQLDPKSALAWIKKGRLDMRGRIYNDAIEAYDSALAIDPNLPVLYKELAYAYYYTRQYDKFRQAYEKYIQLSPGDNQAKEMIINLYFSNKEYDKAIDEANKGLANDPSNFVFYRTLMYAEYELKRYKDAYDAMQKFWALPSKKIRDQDIIYSARIAAANGDTTRAMDFFHQALAKDSNNCDFIGEYAKVLYQAQHFLDAMKEYYVKRDKCGKLSSLEVYYLGRCAYQAQDSVEADTAFGEFIERNPTSPDGWFQKAGVNVRWAVEGKPEDYPAMPYYQKVIDLCKSDPVNNKRYLVQAYDYVGAYYLDPKKGKDIEKGKEYLNDALQLDPNDEFAHSELDAQLKYEKQKEEYLKEQQKQQNH